MAWAEENGIDGYDPYYDNYDDGSYGGFELIPKTCNRCGKSGLVWVKLKGKWVLSWPSDQAKPHVCQTDPADEFTVIGPQRGYQRSLEGL